MPTSYICVRSNSMKWLFNGTTQCPGNSENYTFNLHHFHLFPSLRNCCMSQWGHTHGTYSNQLYLYWKKTVHVCAFLHWLMMGEIVHADVNWNIVLLWRISPFSALFIPHLLVHTVFLALDISKSVSVKHVLMKYSLLNLFNWTWILNSNYSNREFMLLHFRYHCMVAKCQLR